MPTQIEMQNDIDAYQQYHFKKHTQKENTYDENCVFCNI